MRLALITIFPEILNSLAVGIPAQAQKKGSLEVRAFNPRDFTHNAHRTVDDRPYGGGPGMLMQPEPLRDAIQAAKTWLGENTKVLYLTPQGRVLTQNSVSTLATEEALILLAGRYEGVDERLITRYIDAEFSIGDYVLSGGELPALVLIDAITRLIPGVLGDERSHIEDSFTEGLLDCPHYTRPEVFEGERVPEVLLGGNHAVIAKWRKQQSLGRTALRRPDLLMKKTLTQEETALLSEYLKMIEETNHE